MIASEFPPFPKTSPNFLIRSLQVVVWILFRPSVWRAKVQQIDPNISANFSIVNLYKKWRYFPSWQLVFTPLFTWPVIVFCISLVIGTLTQWDLKSAYPVQVIYSAVLGGLATLSSGYLISLGVSFTGGLIFGIFSGLAFGLLPPSSPLTYCSIGFAAGITGSVLRNHMPFMLPATFNLRRLAMWIILSLILGLLGASITNIFFLNNEFNVNSTAQNNISLVMVLLNGSMIAISSILMLVLHVQNFKRIFFISLEIAIISLTCTMIMHDNAQNNNLLLYLASGLNFGVLYAISFGVPFSLAGPTGWQRLAILLASIITGSLWVPVSIFTYKGFSYNLETWAATPIFVLIGYSFRLWRPLFFFIPQILMNIFIFIRDRSYLPQKKSLLNHHPAFWDELNYIIWLDLDQHLILVAQHDLETARQALLVLAFTRHREAVYRTHLELAVQELERLENIQDLNSLLSSMNQWPILAAENPILQRFKKIANDIEVAERHSSVYNIRSALAYERELIDDLEKQLLLNDKPSYSRFLPAVRHWRSLLTERLDQLAVIAEDNKEIDNPYITGVPLGENLGVFVGRIEIFNQIERLLLVPLRPPLFLYGQRRMGKTSLLLNLTRILPSTIHPLFVDCQALSGSTNYVELLYRMVNWMCMSAEKKNSLKITPLPLEKIDPNSPFLSFSIWLDQLDRVMEKLGQLTLIIFDEFETLDSIFKQNNIPSDAFLSFLRHIIQHRHNFRILISGSHSLNELDKWASYLVNSQTIKLGYLREEEAKRLIEKPVDGFPLHYQAEAVEKILHFTRSHPALIQMVCFELVQHKNSQPLSQRYQVLPEDIEDCIPDALENGIFFFQDIKNQVSTGSFHMLIFLAKKGPGGWISAKDWRAAFPEDFDRNLQQLRDRDLIEPAGENGYRVQIELVRRWIAMQEQFIQFN